MPTLTKHKFAFEIDSAEVELSCLSREGQGEPIVFLHGFGSTKEDYADAAWHPLFAGRRLFAYDAPGCGESACSDLEKISIPFLVKTAVAALELEGIDKFHLVGHSMGGLTSLMLAHQYPQRVLSFTDIEGNVAPEDCFLSRQIFQYPHSDPDKFLADFIARNGSSPYFSSPLYATSVRHKVRAGAVRGIFESMVELSDHGSLMEKFIALPMPRMFMFGEQNDALSYLAHLEEQGIELARIPLSGHFPMYSNAPEMWRRIHDFQRRAQCAQSADEGLGILSGLPSSSPNAQPPLRR